MLALDGFDDDPKTSNEPKLEAIQMAWYEEYQEQTAKLKVKSKLSACYSFSF